MNESNPLVPGAQTSEHAALQQSDFFSKVLLVLGIVSTVAGGIVAGVRSTRRRPRRPRARRTSPTPSWR